MSDVGRISRIALAADNLLSDYYDDLKESVVMRAITEDTHYLNERMERIEATRRGLAVLWDHREDV